jgi:hypothetical protein
MKNETSSNTINDSLLELIERFRRTKVAEASTSERALFDEVAGGFVGSAWESLKETLAKWEASKGASFETYAWQQMTWRWKDEVRRVREQRAEVARGHRSNLPMRAMEEFGDEGSPWEELEEGRDDGPPNKTRQPRKGDVPADLQGSSPTGIRRWTNHPEYTEAMNARVRLQIGRVVRSGFFGLEPHQDLTPREAEAAGYYVFGRHFAEAVVSWDRGDFEDVAFIATGVAREYVSKEPTARDIARMMTGNLYPDAVRTLLYQARKKLGVSSNECMFSKVFEGVRHTRIRIREIEARKGVAGQLGIPSPRVIDTPDLRKCG